MNNQEITDHSLHLLVDGQLDAASCKKLQQQIDASPLLQQKLKSIIEIRELVSLAYLQEKAPAPHKSGALLASPTYAAIAASIIMAIGLMLGWVGHQFFQPDPLIIARAIPAPAQIIQSQQPLQRSLQDARKYMMHLDNYDSAGLQKALLETRSILHSYAESGIPVKLDVLLNQRAVELFKPEHAAQIKQIKALIDQYDNIQLYACSKSLKLFLRPDEISSDIQLFHSDQVVEELIPKRIEAGWVYIKA